MTARLLLAALLLAGCQAALPLPPPPAAIADRTTLDEVTGLRVERVYQAAATTILEADRLGLIPAVLRPRVAAADRAAYAAVAAARAAYDVGNASGYVAAATKADAAIADLLRAFRS